MNKPHSQVHYLKEQLCRIILIQQVACFLEKVPCFPEKVPCFPEKVACFLEKVPCFLRKVAYFLGKVAYFLENTRYIAKWFWNKCSHTLLETINVLELVNLTAYSLSNLSRARAYTLEFYLFCCHICHRKTPKYCFSTSCQTNQPLLTKQSIIHSWWQQIKGVFSTVSPPLQTIFSFTERRMWQMWQQNKQNHWVIRAREKH